MMMTKHSWWNTLDIKNISQWCNAVMTFHNTWSGDRAWSSQPMFWCWDVFFQLHKKSLRVFQRQLLLQGREMWLLSNTNIERQRSWCILHPDANNEDVTINPRYMSNQRPSAEQVFYAKSPATWALWTNAVVESPVSDRTWEGGPLFAACTPNNCVDSPVYHSRLFSLYTVGCCVNSQ